MVVKKLGKFFRGILFGVPGRAQDGPGVITFKVLTTSSSLYLSDLLHSHDTTLWSAAVPTLTTPEQELIWLNVPLPLPHHRFGTAFGRLLL